MVARRGMGAEGTAAAAKEANQQLKVWWHTVATARETAVATVVLSCEYAPALALEMEVTAAQSTHLQTVNAEKYSLSCSMIHA